MGCEQSQPKQPSPPQLEYDLEEKRQEVREEEKNVAFLQNLEESNSVFIEEQKKSESKQKQPNAEKEALKQIENEEKEEKKEMKMNISGKQNATSRMKGTQKKRINVDDPVKKELLRVYDL